MRSDLRLRLCVWHRDAKTLATPLLAGFLLLLAPAAARGETPSVLVLHSYGRSLPADIEIDRGLRDAIAHSASPQTELQTESLDEPWFIGEPYEGAAARYLAEKYSSRPPGAIVVVAEEALTFLLRHRKKLFPQTPVVYTDVSRSFLKTIPPLPSDVIGVPVEYDFSGTIEQALRWHPKARRLVLVTGTGLRDREWEALLRAEAPRFERRATIDFLSGQTTGAVLDRLRELGREAVVFTPGYFKDGAGRVYSPRESAAIMAAAARAPVYGPFDTFIGAGVVGGRMVSFEAEGRQAGQIVNALLAGAGPSSLQLPEIMSTQLHIDWRQAQKWGIAGSDIPADAVVHFREPTAWQAHRGLAITAIVVVLIQAALIASLLAERRMRLRTAAARARADLQAEQDRAALHHMTRVSLLGQLSASITHQLGQPLTSILSNAEVAQDILGRNPVDLAELREICADIVSEDHRAADVIHRLAALFKRSDLELREIDLNELVSETLDLTQTELQSRHVTVALELEKPMPRIRGDHVQLQQVLLNLILNAAEAMDETPIEKRRVAVRTTTAGAGVRLTVADGGPGIAAENLKSVFEPFWTTKPGGIGMGLALCRSIAAKHGGTLEVTNGADGGAAFCMTLGLSPDA